MKLRQLVFPIVVGTTVFLLGCSPSKLIRLKMPDLSERAELLVFREPAFNAAGGTLVFGANGEDYAELRNSDYVKIFLVPKSYQFFARDTNTDTPFVLPITLKVMDKKCLKAYANPANIAKVLLTPFLLSPVVHAIGNTFLLKEVSCPLPAELSSYSEITMQYLQ